VNGRLTARQLLDRRDLADLDTAYLNFRVGIHHQTGTLGDHRDGHAVRESTAEELSRYGEDHHDKSEGGQANQRAEQTSPHRSPPRRGEMGTELHPPLGNDKPVPPPTRIR
jgi:hypothetical protein